MSKSHYLHGYSSPEQQRLLEQAAYWRDELILHRTRFAPGESLLEIGCGVGAVLGILGQAQPGLRLHGVDWESRQLALARRHLAGLGFHAQLRQADALALPYPDARFDQAWMMWFLEHVRDPLLALAEARRVLKPGGQLTSIEVDYRTLRVEPWTPAIQALLDGFIQGMDHGGRGDAGTQLEAWLKDAGFAAVRVEPREFLRQGPGLRRHVEYLLGFIEGAIPSLRPLPGMAPEARLREGVADFRAARHVRFTVHKGWAHKAA